MTRDIIIIDPKPTLPHKVLEFSDGGIETVFEGTFKECVSFCDSYKTENTCLIELNGEKVIPVPDH